MPRWEAREDAMEGRWQQLPTGLLSVIPREGLWMNLPLVASLLLMAAEVGSASVTAVPA